MPLTSSKLEVVFNDEPKTKARKWRVMNEEFWQSRWKEKQIGFHQPGPNGLLKANAHRLDLEPGKTVFVPLCGKSLDLDWFLSLGIHVVGIEFNQDAVAEVFERQNLTPAIEEAGSLLRYSADGINLFVGDIFNLSAGLIGPVNAVYDRAALVALAPETRIQYVSQVTALCNHAPQLLIAFDYDQETMNGPPFSIPAQAVERLYGDDYHIERVDSREISGHLAQRCEGSEEMWFLTSK